MTPEIAVPNAARSSSRGVRMASRNKDDLEGTMRTTIPNSIVSVAWLKDHLAAENLVIVDARMKPIGPAPAPPPTDPRYIPGARRFDFDDVLRDPTTSLPHMMPSAASMRSTFAA